MLFSTFWAKNLAFFTNLKRIKSDKNSTPISEMRIWFRKGLNPYLCPVFSKKKRRDHKKLQVSLCSVQFSLLDFPIRFLSLTDLSIATLITCLGSVEFEWVIWAEVDFCTHSLGVQVLFQRFNQELKRHQVCD